MFDNDTLTAMVVALGLLAFGRWLTADQKWPRWKPRVIKGGKR